MADETESGERSERATPKRLADARRRGHLPRSRELAMTLVVLSGAVVLLVASRYFSAGLGGLVAAGLTHSRAETLDAGTLPQALGAALLRALGLLAPLGLALVIASLAGALALGGWSFTLEALLPKTEKLNPAAGLKRVFGVQGVIELAKALGKVLVVGAAVAAVLRHFAPELMALGTIPVEAGIARAARLAAASFLGFAASLAVIGAVDVPVQAWRHRRGLRMTKQEVREELKETEGRPEVRSRIRSLQQQVATRRMMADVPKADVVATNPTHYAVALRYDAGSMKAPKIVAKGTDLVALNIRRIATAHGVPIFEHPPLAQALYHNGRVGREIVPRLYVAVAQVLTYVYQITGRKPVAPGARVLRPRLDIDADLLVPLAEQRRVRREVEQ